MTNARVEASAEDGSIRIALSGEIDLANAAAVEDEIREAVSSQPAKVSVDLTDLTYLDSAGVRILFALASRLQALRIVLDAASADEDALNRHAREIEAMRMQVALAEHRAL